MDRLQAMRVFQRVVDEGGFAAAARALAMSPAGATRMVAALEEHLGVRLLQRPTRKLTLTDAGEAYLLRARAILHEVEDAEPEASAHSCELPGNRPLLATPAPLAPPRRPARRQRQGASASSRRSIRQRRCWWRCKLEGAKSLGALTKLGPLTTWLLL